MALQITVAGYILHENKVLLIHHRKLDKWLPVGGHIQENETPDDALMREIREEVGIDAVFLTASQMPVAGDIKRNLATPFNVNVHSVGDHDHCTLYYVCKAVNPRDIRINVELKDYAWFTKEELDDERIPQDVREQCQKVFELANA